MAQILELILITITIEKLTKYLISEKIESRNTEAEVHKIKTITVERK